MKFLASTLVSLTLFAVAAQAQTPVETTTAPQRAKAKRVRANVQTDEARPAAVSAPATTTRTRAPQTSDNMAWIKARSTVGAFISTASDLSADGASLRVAQGGQIFKGSGSLSSQSAIGVAAQLTEMRSLNWGWFAGASIEQSREIASGNLTLGQVRLQGPFTNKPRFLPLIVSGGAVYKFNNQIYASGGVNYTLYKDFGGGDFANASMDPKLGFQYGLGFKPFPRLAFELMQRDVRYSFDGTLGGNKVVLDDVRLTGFNIVGRYDLE